MNLGENIYRLRTEKNMSQGDLADALEVSRQSVSKWENNAAVPELDKLIKMADLFGVTLDEMVGKEIPSHPQVTCYPPVEPAPRQGMPTRKIVGIVLLCFGFITFLVFAALSFFPDLDIDFSFSLIFSAPLVLCGILCLVCRHNPGYWCAISLYFWAWLLFMAVAANFGTMAFIVRTMQVIVGLWLLLWTIIRSLCGKLQMPKLGKFLVAALLTVSLIITIVSMLPPKTQIIGEGIGTGAIQEGDVSVSPD